MPETAHLHFINTRETNNTSGTVLAHHLIPSFYPGEVTPNKAHEIGEELAKKILKGQYEYVIATHVDKGHIHNHIIFNNVNFKTGKCYKSNTRTYHTIRTENDKLCEKYHLVVIDEYYAEGNIKKRIEHEVNFNSKRPKAPFKPVKSVIDISLLMRRLKALLDTNFGLQSITFMLWQILFISLF